MPSHLITAAERERKTHDNVPPTQANASVPKQGNCLPRLGLGT